MDDSENDRRQDLRWRQHPSSTGIHSSSGTDAQATNGNIAQFPRVVSPQAASLIHGEPVADAIKGEGAIHDEELGDHQDAMPATTAAAAAATSCHARVTDNSHASVDMTVAAESDSLLSADGKGGEASNIGRQEEAARMPSTFNDGTQSRETDEGASRTAQQQHQQQQEEELADEKLTNVPATISIPSTSADADSIAKSALDTHLSPSMQAVMQIVDTPSEEFNTSTNTAENTSRDAMADMDRGSLLGPHSREARSQHKRRQSANAGRKGSAAATTAVSPTTTAVSPNPNRIGNRDHRVALDLARQDLADKACTGALDNTTPATPSRAAPAMSAVAASSRKLKSPPTQTSLCRWQPVDSSPNTTAAARIASSTASRPSTTSLPVGAFRIQPSQTGAPFDITAPSAVDESITNHDDSTAHDEPTDGALSEILESSLVVESVLVDDLLLSENDGSSRRRNRRSHGINEGNPDFDTDASVNNRDGSNFGTAGSHSRNNPCLDEERAMPAVPEATSTSRDVTPSLHTLIPTEASSPALNDSEYVVVTAEAPTLNGSIWTLVKSRKGRWGLLILIALIATLTVLGVTVLKNNTPDKGGSDNKNDAVEFMPTFFPSLGPSLTPSLAPTTLAPTFSPTRRAFMPEDLPAATTAMIEKNPSSPQALAWQWILEDIRIRHSTESDSRTFPELIPQYQQSIQRFALATIYFATNGPGWQNSIFWLDHRTSECDWYPHVEAIAWPYEQGPTVCNATTGAYTDLLLSDNFLEGSNGLPMEAALLTGLRVIDVSNNPQLVGSIPTEFCNSILSKLDVRISCNANLTCGCGCQCV